MHSGRLPAVITPPDEERIERRARDERGTVKSPCLEALSLVRAVLSAIAALVRRRETRLRRADGVTLVVPAP